MALIEEKVIDGYGNKLLLYAEETGTSTSGNYSSIHTWLDLYVRGSVSSSNIRVGISGSNEVSLGYKSYGSGTHRLIDGYYNAPHNNDGSGSTFVSGYFYSNIGDWGLGGTLYLTQINRYPILNSGSNFTDEGNPTYNITAFNMYPIRVKIEAGGNTQLITRDLDTQDTTTYTLELTNEERNILRALCTNSNTLKVTETVCAMDGNRELSASYKSYTMTIVNANPTFSNYSVADTNPTTIALTGSTTDNVININGYSNIQATVTTNDIAEAKKYATMSKYRFKIGDSSVDIPYNSQDNTSGTINGATTGIYELYAIDSRNNSTLVTKQATSIINYEKVYIDKQGCSFVRDDNQVGENAILTLSGTFWNDDFGEVVNSLSVSYRLKKTDSDIWIDGTTTITPTTSGNSFSFTGQIASDNISTKWDLDANYNLEVIVSDELSSAVIDTLVLNSAIPTMSIDKQGIGIMCAYDSSKGGKLQVDGVPIDIEKYSTSEVKTNKIWINDEPIYRKVISLGSLPNSSSKNVAHNVSNLGRIVNIYGFAYSSTYTFCLPYTTNTNSSNIALYSSSTNVIIETGQDRSNFTGYAIIEYTKSS